MASTDASDVSEGPVMSLISKRLRALRKKYNRIVQLEEAVAQGKSIVKEQQDVLRSKPGVISLMEELEKIRAPLTAAVSEETTLAVQRHIAAAASTDHESTATDKADEAIDDAKIEDLVNLLYLGSLFDVKPQNDFRSIMLTRTMERGCCLSYDYVTDDATDLLSEKDLDMISMLGNLVISRPTDSSLSHKDALPRCIEHAKLFLANSNKAIDPNASVSYERLREKLRKIMASDYFTITPEMKAHVEVAAAAAAKNYASFQVVPVHDSVVVPLKGQEPVGQYQEKEEATNFEEQAVADTNTKSAPVEEYQKEEVETQTHSIAISDHQHEQVNPTSEGEQNQREIDQQNYQRRSHHNQRGGNGGYGNGNGAGNGGRRGYSNGPRGRGGRGGGPYQNGRGGQYYEQQGNYYPRNYNNSRGRGGRGGGYNNHGSGAEGGHASSGVGVGVAS